MHRFAEKTYLFGAQQGSFDDYCIYLEWNREPDKRFYLPRRDVLLPLANDLQDLMDRKLDFLAKYDAYLNQLKDRKKLGAKELMVVTRWNAFDPLGRIQMQYADNPRYRFRVIPALNENDESSHF